MGISSFRSGQLLHRSPPNSTRRRPLKTLVMHRLRRRETRRRYYGAAKIKLAAGARACDYTVVDISDSGVRLNVEGLMCPMSSCCCISNEPEVQGPIR